MSGRVYTIGSGTPFLKALAQGLLERHPATDDPFALAAVTVFLPTRRAVRGLEEAFLDAQAARGRAALFLPRMRPLGSVDEDEITLDAEDEDAILDIPPAVPALHRRVRLAQLLMHSRSMPFAEALGWAKSLARFLDETLIEEVDLNQLEAVVPQDLARHFQSSREFIQILTGHWQAILAEDGYIEAPLRRKRLMAAEAKRWQRLPPSAIYIAGSTGSIPATADLMAAALALPQGALILPGLDRGLDEEAWQQVEETHPQYGLKRLLERLEIAREAVADWPYTEGLVPAAPARVRLIAETLRPAPTTDSWARSLAGVPLEGALAGLKLAIARDQAEEARVVALAMRQVIEHPGETAALVTPDRSLARRVSAELKRWGIEVDDSAGVPLAQMPPMILLRLIVGAVRSHLAPGPLLALLKHPLARIGYEPAGLHSASAALERLALRGPRPAPGIAGLRARLDAAQLEREQREMTADEQASHERRFVRARGLIEHLKQALAPLIDVIARPRATPAAWVIALTSVAERVCDGGIIWQGDAGEAAAGILRMIGDVTAVGDITLNDFVHFFEAATEGLLIRPRAGLHPRLNIWGPLEARLQSADLIILGGLNEGIWPARAEIDPWANRPMRDKLGLSKPERRIGLAAHDFQELAAAPRVLLTASKKVDGSPVLLSRWLMRLENFLTGRGAHGHLAAEPFVDWARMLDAPRSPRPVARPMPTPAVALRPRSFRITDIKTLRRDPYAIYAREILKLRPLDPVDEEATPRLRGTLLHKILEDFAIAYPDRLPEDPVNRLMAIGDARIAEARLEPEVKELWRAMLKRAAIPLIEWEAEERERARIAAIERSGRIDIKLANASISLRGRIDRIDADLETGGLTIIDYKSGKTPTGDQIEAMLDPQLPLSALLVQAGALESIAPAPIDGLLYLHVGGGSQKLRAPVEADIPKLIADTGTGLVALLERYEAETTPYHSWAIPFSTSDVGDYDLLARVAEWRIDSGDEE